MWSPDSTQLVCWESQTVSPASAEPDGPLNHVSVSYHDFSDNGIDVLVGTENTTSTNLNATTSLVDWYSDLTQTGSSTSTKRTSPGGFHLTIDILLNVFRATGTLTTTIDGVEYLQPLNGA